MDPHLYQAARQLPSGDVRVKQLYDLAVSPGKPQTVEARVRMGLWMVAALLLATGLIFWIAANWQEQSRWFKLCLIEAALLASVAVACVWPRMRLAALLCATLILGGLLAFVGQTYQTGADAWQLFAVWAALALIWVVMSRSDFLWALWVLIAALGIVMWTGRLGLEDIFFKVHGNPFHILINMALWLPLAVLPAVLSFWKALRVDTGMGWWSHRIAIAGALTVWVGCGVMQMSDGTEGVSALVVVVAVLLVAATLYLSLHGRFQDFVSTSLAALAANTLFLAFVGRWLAENSGLETLLLFSLIVLGCLGVSVRWLMEVQRRMRAQKSALVQTQEAGQ